MIFEQLVSLFTEMDLIAAICLLSGLVLAIAEVYQPGFRALGVLSAILTGAGIFLRVSTEPVENVFAMTFMLIFIFALILVLAFFIMVSTVRRSWLMGAPESGLEDGPAEDGGVDYSALKGKLGVATTMLRPLGRAEIDDEIYEVVADGFFINRGQVVKVIATKGSKIIVCRADI